MIIGFTGTQKGMTPAQRALFVETIKKIQPTVFHHGDCVGADAEAHALIREHVPRCLIVVHPPVNTSRRAYCTGDMTWEAKPYLERNRDIVTCCQELIAAPDGPTEKLRSGTWATIRAAWHTNRRVQMVPP